MRNVLFTISGMIVNNLDLPKEKNLVNNEELIIKGKKYYINEIFNYYNSNEKESYKVIFLEGVSNV